jgi:hypothetical protein
MPEEFNREAAIEALQTDSPEDDRMQDFYDPMAKNREEQAPQTTPSEESDPFTGVDPNSLPAELQAIYRSMQSDYTKKSQEVADLRNQYGDPDRVGKALEFVDALQDPNNLLQLHSELTDYLQRMGLSQAEAEQVAAKEIQTQYGEDDDLESFEDTSVNDELRRELEEVRGFRESLQEERLQAEVEASLSRQENMIRQARPDYTDEDVSSIYERAYAYGGDLTKAQQSFERDKQRLLVAYTTNKEALSAGITAPISTAPGAERPTQFTDMDEAHEYAKAFIRGEQSVA